jgi:hypothetical protein
MTALDLRAIARALGVLSTTGFRSRWRAGLISSL